MSLVINDSSENSLLSIDDNNFVVLNDVSTINLFYSLNLKKVTFTFYYNVNIIDVIKNNALKVKITLYDNTLISEIESQINNLSKLRGPAAFRAASKRTLLLKQLQQAKNDSVITYKVSDITSKINNQIVSKILSGKNVSEIPELFSKGLVVNNSNLYNLIVTNNNEKSYDKNKISKLIKDMILLNGVDVSYIKKLTNTTISPSQTSNGTKNTPTKLEEKDSISTELLKTLISYSNESNSKSLSTGFGKIDNSILEIPLTFNNVFLNNLLNKNVYVKFELLKFNNRTKKDVVIDTIQKKFDIQKQLDAYYVPTKTPTLSVSTPNSSNISILNIKQNDYKANKVKVFQKNISLNSSDNQNYQLHSEHEIQSGITKHIKINPNTHSPTIYRVIPSRGNIDCCDYENIVVSPKISKKPENKLVLTLYQKASKIILEARNFPSNCSSIQFLVRDKTLNQIKFSIVNNKTISIDGNIRSLNFYSDTHENLKENHTYQYVIKAIYNNGNERYSNYSALEYLSPEPGKVDTKISNITITKLNNVDVQFDIKTSVTDTHISNVLKLLDSQKILDFYKNDIESIKSSLNNLVSHHIIRTDVQTGERVDFGIITDGKFSDIGLGKKNNAQRLSFGKSYRYEIYTLMRSTETLIEKISETTSTNYKKPYKINWAKYFHPLVSKTGTLYTNLGRKIQFSKDEMTHGAIGDVEIVDVSISKLDSTINNATVTQAGVNKHLVSWQVIGDIKDFDCFLIFKIENNVKTLIGKSHSQFSYDCKFIYELTKNDIGNYVYAILPVYQNYTVGNEIMTNSITVNKIM